MIEWREFAEFEWPEPPPGKPILVTRFEPHWYWKTRVGPVYGAFFRHYWQANIVSWFYHHVLRQSCNTWVRDSPSANP